MALFLYLLTKRGSVNLAELAGKLGMDVKELEDRIEALDRKMERDYRRYVPRPEPAEEERIAEVNRQIRIPTKWRRRPG